MLENYQMITMGFLGQSGVGKTHIIHRYVVNAYPQKLTSTIAIQFCNASYTLQDGNLIRLKFWDTSGQDKYKDIVCYHLKQAKGVFIVFDISDKKSFSKIDQWIERIKKQKIQYDLLILLGNKNDLQDNRAVSKKAAQKKAQQIAAYYYEISSFDYEKTKQIIDQVVQTLWQKKVQKMIKQKQQELKKSQFYISSKIQALPQSNQIIADQSVCSDCQIY